MVVETPQLPGGQRQDWAKARLGKDSSETLSQK
jgi:hypothetical protein